MAGLDHRAAGNSGVLHLVAPERRNHASLSRIKEKLCMGNLLATKPLDTLMKEAGETGEHSLKRALGPVNLITLGIGAIIGAGIFVLTGHAAAANAGPAIVFSYLLGAIACAFAGLCYAEMAST